MELKISGKKISGKKVFYIFYLTFIISGLIWWGYNQYKDYKAKRISYHALKYNGVIRDSVHFELQHDLPTYNFTNGTSHFSGLGEGYMQVIAKVGDSLSKESGNDTVYVFRKNDSGNYVRINYK